MAIPRVIPVLLLKNKGLVKTKKFADETYIGDPLNAVKIFNEKEVDEIILLDILATKNKYTPRFSYIQDIVSECFMPVGYGGGITTLEEIKQLNKIGVEKVIINSHAAKNPEFIKQACERFGSSTIVVSIDVKKNILGKTHVYTHSGTVNTKIDPLEFALQMQECGVGEIMLNSIDKDGMMSGYDIDGIKKMAEKLSIPLIACGGASNYQDMKKVITEANASAVAAGSMFVFHGKQKGVLISYLDKEQLNELRT